MSSGKPSAAEEFYIGYLPDSPPRLARSTRWIVVVVLLSALVLGGVLASGQADFTPSTFEFGVTRSFEGVVSEHPYPTLLVERPGRHRQSDDERLGGSRYLLVALGKHGAQAPVAGLDGRRVRLEGSLVYYQGRTMIEIAEGSIEELGSAAVVSSNASESLGVRTYVGEIVDSKCHLGVMNPGSRKAHRACATLCIRGGIPPILFVEDGLGGVEKLLLVDADGGAVNDRILDMVADRVRITGEVLRSDDLLLLKADPATYERLDE